MDTVAPFIAYAAALSLAAAIPGPGIAALVGQSLGNGLRVSLFFLAGIALGDILYLTVAVAGLAAVAQLFTGAFLVIKVLGGAYLIWLAFKFWSDRAGLVQTGTVKRGKSFATLLAGFTVTLGNPKTIVFYLALLPTVIDLEAVRLTDWVTLCALTIMVLFATLTPYAFLASTAQGLMNQPKALRRLNRFAAGFIGGAGVLILGQAAGAVFRRA